MRLRSSLVLVAALSVVACKKPAEPGKPAAGGEAPAAAASADQIKGKVLERVDAAPYSYLKLGTSGGEKWAAVPQTEAKVGSEVTVTVSAPMANFESKTLNKKFDVVYFGTLGGDAPAPAAAPGAGAMAGGMPGGMPGAGGDQPNPAQMAAQHQAAAQGPDNVKIAKIARATGADGKTVEELWTQRSSLKEKSVTVKGQVVKFTPGIMGRNWIHLRDGTGSGDKNTNDVTITTQDDAKVGDVVTVKGTVRLDKDFGAGYAYPVIVEDAKVSAAK